MRIGPGGFGKSKLSQSAPARDLYVSLLFRARREWVERSCDTWFILSAEHRPRPLTSARVASLWPHCRRR